jgi:hypothetical protein
MIRSSDGYIPLVMDENPSRDLVSESNASRLSDQTGLDIPVDTSPEDVDARQKRGAAIRAREKILEWTKHLFTRLQ